ncbi:MAG: hypothetical protein V9F05_15665 [Chitinophagaceae bacterium]
MKKTLLIFISTLTIISCTPSDPNKNIDEGKVEGNTYTSQEIGWTIAIPDGWEVVDREKSEDMREKGTQALEETIDQEVDFSGVKTLIAFQKNQFNIFQSTSEPFKLEYEGEWEINNAAIKALIFETFVNQGIKADSSATSVETIDGLDFQTYSFTIYGPTCEVILKQILYSRLINGFDFAANINYNNEKDKETQLQAFRNSKFKK